MHFKCTAMLLYTKVLRHFSHAFQNSLWMVVDQVACKLFLAGISILSARSLGPECFGILSLALSIVLVCKDTLAPLGLGGVFIRDLIENPTRHSELLGSALLMRLFSGFGAFIVAVFVLTYMGTDRPRLLNVGLVLAASIFVPNIISLYFESILSSWRNAVSNLLGNITALVLAAMFYLLHADVIAFAAAITAMYLVQAVAQTYQLALVRKHLMHMRARLKTMVGLLSESWPLIISGAAATVYNRIDVVMLGALSSTAEVGFYSAASRIAESTAVFGLAIAASLFPGIVRARKASSPSAETKLLRLATLMLYTGTLVSAALFFAGPAAVTALFGESFYPSVPIIQIYSFAVVFIYLGIFLSKWLIIERLVKYSIMRHVLGAFANILFNIVLIPPYGGVGAAVATVAAHFFAVCIVCAGNGPLRPALALMLGGALQPLKRSAAAWKAVGRHSLWRP